MALSEFPSPSLTALVQKKGLKMKDLVCLGSYHKAVKFKKMTVYIPAKLKILSSGIMWVHF
jgi:hypothetical protein